MIQVIEKNENKIVIETYEATDNVDDIIHSDEFFWNDLSVNCSDADVFLTLLDASTGIEYRIKDYYGYDALELMKEVGTYTVYAI